MLIGRSGREVGGERGGCHRFSRKAPRRELVFTRLAHGSSSVNPAFARTARQGGGHNREFWLSQNWARVAVEYALWYSGPVIIALVADA